MIELTYFIKFATEIPLPFSYFIKRAAIRLFFNLPKFLILSLIITVIMAIIYFLITSGPVAQPKFRAGVALQRRPYPIGPARKATGTSSRDVYKKRQEEKRMKRKELIEKAVKK